MSAQDTDPPARDLVIDAGDGADELNPQDHTAPASSVHDSVGTKTQSNKKVGDATNQEVQLNVSTSDRDSVAKQQSCELGDQAPHEQRAKSTDTSPAQETRIQEEKVLQREDSAKPHEPTEQMLSASRLEHNHILGIPAMNKAVSSEPTSEDNNRLSRHTTAIVAETQEYQPVAKTPESVRGNPYLLAAPLAARNQQAHQNDLVMGEPQAISNRGYASMAAQAPPVQNTQAKKAEEAQPTHSRHELDIETATSHQQIEDEQSDSAKGSSEEDEADVEMRFTQNDSSNDSDTEDDEEEDDGHMATMQSRLKAGVARLKSTQLGQRQQPRQGDINMFNPGQGQNFDQFQGYPDTRYDPRLGGYGAPPRIQQYPVSHYSQNAHGAPSMPAPSNSDDSRHDGRQQMPNHQSPREDLRVMPGFPPLDPRSWPFSAGAPMHQGVPMGLPQLPQHARELPNLGFPLLSYSKQAPLPAYSTYPTSAHDKGAHAPMGNHSNSHASSFQAPSGHASGQTHKARKVGVAEVIDISDDDEPLRTRVPRHPSVLSDSVMGESPPHRADPQEDEHDCGGDDDNAEFLKQLKATQLPQAIDKVQKAPSKQRVETQPTQTSSPTKAASESNAAAASIDWTLPKYDVQVEPGKDKDDPTIAKVSLPGLYREEVILSADHSEQEVHLFVTCFLPGQQALAMPDPLPANAIMNFHTIAVMVIEAFVQYEIGDEFGTGRGHWHDDHDQGEAEYQRLRNATDADPDEIFFAVIDRWRAGIESNKQPAKLIRGAQEFCDTALELVYYIKEHGLLKPKPKERAVRSDKGVKRGARKVGDENEDEGAGKGKSAGKGKGKAEEGKTATKSGNKRGAGADKVNNLEPRKKAKVKKPKVADSKQKPKPKSRKKQPTLVVIRKP